MKIIDTIEKEKKCNYFTISSHNLLFKNNFVTKKPKTKDNKKYICKIPELIILIIIKYNREKSIIYIKVKIILDILLPVNKNFRFKPVAT